MTKLSISLEGIEQALRSLNYRENSTKQQFILAIQAYYTSEEDIARPTSIDTDTLIKTIWHLPDDPARIRSKQGPGFSLHGRRHHPVVQVNFADACSFAAWIGRRLPTEAEGEAAARTGLGLKYPWGSGVCRKYFYNKKGNTIGEITLYKQNIETSTQDGQKKY